MNAIYPGTFDPIHNGHIDIATRAAKLFDELEFNSISINFPCLTLFTFLNPRSFKDFFIVFPWGSRIAFLNITSILTFIELQNT